MLHAAIGGDGVKAGNTGRVFYKLVNGEYVFLKYDPKHKDKLNNDTLLAECDKKLNIFDLERKSL